MSAPHRTEALAAPSLTAAVVALRARGMRVSGTRRTLLQTLFATDGPRTADEPRRRIEGVIEPDRA